MSKPSTIWLYRITHIDNLEHIVQNGLVTASHASANPKYVSIGDSTLIEYRKELKAMDPPGGELKDYIPFYLGPRSPMLLQIATGWEDIVKMDQQEIIYLISSLDKIKQFKLPYFFADGHARSETSTFYIDERDFDKLDWETIYSSYWKSDETDLRRKEKKQAELLVKDHMPWGCIDYVGVFNDLAKQRVEEILQNCGASCRIRVSPQKLYY